MPAGSPAWAPTSAFAAGSPVRYYHGGPPGLTEILPRGITGQRGTGHIAAPGLVHGRPGDANSIARGPDRAYVTTLPKLARAYAACWAATSGQDACVYVARPASVPERGEVPTCWAVTSAQVLRVHRTVTEQEWPALNKWVYRWYPLAAEEWRNIPSVQVVAALRALIDRGIAQGVDRSVWIDHAVRALDG